MARAGTSTHDRRATAFMPVAWRAVACLALLALVLAAPPGAAARKLEDQEKTALAAAVTQFDQAMREARYGDVIDAVPPRIFAAIAGKAGASVAQLRKLMLEQIDSTMKAVTLVSFGMDLPKADYKELPSGHPYVLIPTQTVMEAPGMGRITVRTHTVAVLDAGKWYLVRVEDQNQVAVLRETYPEFAAVEFAKGTMEIEKQ